MSAANARELPTKIVFRLPKPAIFLNSELVFKLLFTFYNIMPAFLADKFISYRGLKPMQLMKITRTVYSVVKVFRNYDAHFTFDKHNMAKISQGMTEGDRCLFSCTMNPEDYDNFVLDSIKGLRLYFLKENEKDLEVAKKSISRLYMIDLFINLVLIVGLFHLYFIIAPILITWFYAFKTLTKEHFSVENSL